jgi:hypothetical protein
LFGIFCFGEYTLVKGGAMAQKGKRVSKLTSGEIKKIKETLGAALEVYSKGDFAVKKEALRILDGWGRIIFIISNDGKRIGLELTERWERERAVDEEERMLSL